MEIIKRDDIRQLLLSNGAVQFHLVPEGLLEAVFVFFESPMFLMCGAGVRNPCSVERELVAVSTYLFSLLGFCSGCVQNKTKGCE